MADERKIVIELKNIGEELTNPSDKEKQNQNKELQKTVKSLFHPIKTAENATIGRNIIALEAWNMAKNTVKEVGNYHIYKYFTLNENYLAETEYNNMMTGIKKVTGFGTAVAAGAIAGAALGPAGAVAGGTIGAIGWGVSQVIQANQAKLEQQIQFNTNNYQSQFQQTRLGLIDGRGVTNQ